VKIRSRKSIIYGAIFVVLFFICFLFPYSGDDWAWGSKIGIERLNTWFDNYSGRYFGNLIVLALTRSSFLKALAMSCCLGGIIVILNEITQRQKCALCFIVLALAYMPVTLLRQSVVWTSGFSNYTTSIFFTLIYIYYVRKIYTEKPENSYIISVIMVILGFLNTLIVEHLTIYNIVLGIYVIVFTLIKYRKVYIQHIAYLLGCILGTIMMFSNSVYSSVAKGKDEYRTITSDKGIISRAYDSFIHVIVKEGFLNNFILLGCLIVVCLIVWFEVKEKISGKARVAGYISMFINISYLALCFMEKLNTYWLRGEALLVLEAATTILYVLALIAFVFILPYEMIKKVELLFVLLSALFMMAPLFVVTPIGSRCFFASYIMFIYFVILLFSNIEEVHKKQFANLNRTLCVISIIGTMYLFYIYGSIAYNDYQRIQKAIADGKTKKSITIEELPYKDYVWASDAEEEPWSTRFKLYYGINEKAKITMVPHE